MNHLRMHRWIVLGMILTLTIATVVWAETAVYRAFIAHENNPILELGSPGEWDGGTIILPEVVKADGGYHLFYTGIMTAFSSPATIGYASSPDGLTWAKHAHNPILTGDATGFDAEMVANPAVMYDNGIWTMYYGGKPTMPLTPNDLQVGRATAPNPWGPWTRNETPVLTVGSHREWDSGFVEPNSILKTNDGYIMYYTGGRDFFMGAGFMLGMATSPNGIVWTKYNDPATTEAPYAESDPVLRPGVAGTWDHAMAWEGQVRRTACGWEMYYSGATSLFEAAIGYATSPDGIHWTKDRTNPIYRAADDPVTAGTANVVEGPTVIEVGNERWLYYDYGQGDDLPAVGVAVAPLSCYANYLPSIVKP